MAQSAGAAFELGAWRIDPAAGEIAPRVGGEATRLEPRMMELLLLFAGSGGRVIGKDEIATAVWGGRAIGDDTLAAAISKLRKTLGETKAERYIETLPKRGYRLAAEMAEAEPARRPLRFTSTATEADALIAQGHAALKVPLPANLAQAQLYFEKAVEADPGCGAAHAGIAETLLLQSFAGVAQPSILLPAAKNAARTATAFDPGCVAGWTCLGAAILLADRDFDQADAALSRAIGLDPGYAMARRQRAFALALKGRFAQAEREARAAVDCEPYSLLGRSVLLRVLTLTRRYRAVIAEAREVIDLAPQASEAWAAKGWAYHFLGETAEALGALLESLKMWSVEPAMLETLRRIHDSEGFDAFAAASADLFERQTVVFKPRPLDVAMLRAAAGQADAAFDALEAALAKDDPFLLALPWLPHLDRLRNDHRFPAFEARLRLVR
jgi:DNA-binding winged helix-turn-helix (wHTH) protein